MMLDRICSDFGVKLAAQNGDHYLLFKARGHFWHFVNITIGVYHSIRQQYLHRYHLAAAFAQLKPGNSGGSATMFFPMPERLPHLAVLSDEQGEWSIQLEEIFCLPSSSEFVKLIKKDIATLEKGRKMLTDSPAQAAHFILDFFNQRVRSGSLYESEMSELSVVDLEMLLFEIHGEPTKKLRSPSIRSAYLEFFAHLGNRTDLESFNHPWDYTGVFHLLMNGGCGTDPDLCFCELLSAVRNRYFPNVSPDESAIVGRLIEVYKGLSPRQQAFLVFLTNQLDNIPLINLYLLLPEAEFSGYLKRLCSPYQPDSDGELFVRSTVMSAITLLENGYKEKAD